MKDDDRTSVINDEQMAKVIIAALHQVKARKVIILGEEGLVSFSLSTLELPSFHVPAVNEDE